MDLSDDTLQAYVDGALPADQVGRIEAAIASDVLVAARVERARHLRAQPRGAFDTPSRAAASQSAPRSTRALCAAKVDDVVDTRRGPASPRRRWRTAVIALAATIGALVIAQRLRTPGADIVVVDGALVARGELQRRLDVGLAAESDPSSTVSLGLTFRAVDGRVCRSFVARVPRVAGLACRTGGDWTLPVVSAVDGRADALPSAGDVPTEVLAAIERRLQGDTFDAARERRARDAGWR
ncbi:anti-sigma factor family protein [Cognatilysobacter segetis]|uniref:anti-sigma factor family protein n=1 Tax=Cognatilysobacter segetis TaxID=2492394 RepID=UPI00105D02AE|nr:hypothetical protein [Lysobacter segetis]